MQEFPFPAFNFWSILIAAAFPYEIIFAFLHSFFAGIGISLERFAVRARICLAGL
jgi:hypothetical protein